jgi:hypothetical protein
MKPGRLPTATANDPDFGNSRWQLVKMLHQFREWAEEVTPTFCGSA